MDENKNQITPLNWILSIGGIVILVCLIVLPPVFRVAFKEKEKPIDDTKIVVEHMTCSKKNFVVEGHYENDNIEFSYVSDRITTYSRVREMIFDDVISFEEYKKEYGKLSTAYSLIKTGIDHKLNVDDSILKISLTENFNLGSFVSTSVTIPGDNSPTPINSDFTREELVSDIKKELTSEGYNCVVR